jgi:hypothetical protein
MVCRSRLGADDESTVRQHGGIICTGAGVDMSTANESEDDRAR